MFLWCAAVMSLITFVVHTFIGGRFVARPLLADETLPKASKWLNYYCWHITTVMILFVAAGFAGLALWESSLREIAFLSSLTLSLSILSAWVAMKGGIHPLRFPSTSLFGVTSILGWLALGIL